MKTFHIPLKTAHLFNRFIYSCLIVFEFGLFNNCLTINSKIEYLS